MPYANAYTTIVIEKSKRKKHVLAMYYLKAYLPAILIFQRVYKNDNVSISSFYFTVYYRSLTKPVT